MQREDTMHGVESLLARMRAREKVNDHRRLPASGGPPVGHEKRRTRERLNNLFMDRFVARKLGRVEAELDLFVDGEHVATSSLWRQLF